jgi:PhoD-like phosphatase
VVETDIPCMVEILGHSGARLQVAGKHYGLVVISGLEPASSVEYEVHLDGQRRWPPAASDFPPSRIQTLPERGGLEVAFGSCRVTAPNEPPFTLTPDQDKRGIGVDALQALALRLRDRDSDQWPRLLLLIGDQVYADEVSSHTLELITARRDVSSAPGEEVLDFEEYRWLYHEAWSPRALRWLLSAIPTAMIFDDHDVHDDWNISDSWVHDMRAKPWWQERIVAALSSYWVYQHLGNLSPAELQKDDLYQQVLRAEDAEPLLREFALAADREEGGSLWSFSRDLADSRLLVIDSREGRVLGSGHRQMLDEQEWRWTEEQTPGNARPARAAPGACCAKPRLPGRLLAVSPPALKPRARRVQTRPPLTGARFARAPRRARGQGNRAPRSTGRCSSRRCSRTGGQPADRRPKPVADARAGQN